MCMRMRMCTCVCVCVCDTSILQPSLSLRHAQTHTASSATRSQNSWRRSTSSMSSFPDLPNRRTQFNHDDSSPSPLYAGEHVRADVHELWVHARTTSHTHAHARITCTHAHTHTCTRTHAHMHMRTHHRPPYPRISSIQLLSVLRNPRERRGRFLLSPSLRPVE